VLPSPAPASRQNSSQVTYSSLDISAGEKGYSFTDPKNTDLWVNAAVYLQMGFLHIPVMIKHDLNCNEFISRSGTVQDI
jgi:hypothetical protein